MKTLILVASLVTFGFQAFAQKEYVCSPCGYKCDSDIHTKPGTCTACNMELVDKSSIKFKNLSVEEFAQRIEANPTALVLDVRSPEEFKGITGEMPSFGHFKNAININVQELERRLSELSKYKDKEVLVYCSHSHRSPRASYILNTNGFKNVSNMSGGVSTILNKQSTLMSKVFVPHSH
jgi:rhodanese-related sulfurtransferase/DNA-directed RNA polymerase subunit RPC12/RpoP